MLCPPPVGSHPIRDFLRHVPGLFAVYGDQLAQGVGDVLGQVDQQLGALASVVAHTFAVLLVARAMRRCHFFRFSITWLAWSPLSHCSACTPVIFMTNLPSTSSDGSRTSP